MPSPIKPKALEPGATIAFISPSARMSHIVPDIMARATSVLTSKGYKVKELYTPVTGIQPSITTRLSELRAAFYDPTISAIICTIGGPCFNELLPSLVADTALQAYIRAHPKIVIGYSDITGLHWFLHALTGLRTFYGPGAIPELGDDGSVDDPATPLAFCAAELFRAIADKKPLGDIARSGAYAPKVQSYFLDPASREEQAVAPSPKWTWLRPGKARGRLFGGCLTVAVRLGAVRAIVPDWRGRIVFLETAGSDDLRGLALARVQAGFADLVAQGVFDEAAGLVVGRAFGYDSEEDRERYAGVIKGLLCEGPLAENPFPILFNVDIGHTTPMVTLPFDALAELDSERDRFAVLESGVE